nr:hypothetical protein [Tanacetum cinerariifolium]
MGTNPMEVGVADGGLWCSLRMVLCGGGCGWWCGCCSVVVAAYGGAGCGQRWCGGFYSYNNTTPQHTNPHVKGHLIMNQSFYTIDFSGLFGYNNGDYCKIDWGSR